jgi:hypothetical protein
MMKPAKSAITYFLLLTATAVTFSLSCTKPSLYTYFIAGDLLWMPYDTATVQDQFTDENGNIHELRLIDRDIRHENIGTDRNEWYNNRIVAELMLDTVRVVVDLTKSPVRTSLYGGSWTTELILNLEIGDFPVDEANKQEAFYQDSVSIGSNYFNDVLVLMYDTANSSRQCWKIYYNRDQGLLRADFRNGHYYELE